MARRRKCVLASEQMLDNKGVRCFIVLLHLLVLIIGITSILFGVGSFLFSSSSSIKNIPHFNCTLTTSVRNYLHFPLKILPVLTGTVLILVDVSVLCLALVIKSCGCGRLAVTWYLSVATCTATWTVWCALYLNTLAPHWLQDRRTCNDMVVGVVLVGAGLVCLVTLIYLAISLVVLVYECCGRKRQQQRDVIGQHAL